MSVNKKLPASVPKSTVLLLRLKTEVNLEGSLTVVSLSKIITGLERSIYSDKK